MRYWCDYRELEEYHAGMWRRVSSKEMREELTEQGAAFLKNSDMFRMGMRRVLAEWPVSCRYNFTNPSLNKPVWLAHAAAALMFGIPEEPMRAAYYRLTKEEQDRADADCAEIYQEWRHAQAIP